MLHHIVCDGWSLGVLYQELGEIYRALIRRERSNLPAVLLQYGDYAAWQQQRVARNEFAKEAEFWKQYLKGAPETIELPSEHRRPDTFTYRGEKRIFPLGEAITSEVRSFSRGETVSVFTTLTAVFQTLLYRYTGQEDVVLGVPIANRDQPELASLFGFLIDFQALRGDLSGNPTFRDVLRRVQQGLLQINANRAIPFDKVVETLRPRRDSSRAPLFQTMLIWKDRAVQMQFMELEGLTVSHLDAHPQSAKFDLTLFLTDAGKEIWLEVEYCTDLFGADTISRLARHFQTLLSAAMANPDERVDALPILSPPKTDNCLSTGT